MKRLKTILLLILACVTLAKAQSNPPFGLLTDRDVYASGETVMTKIYTPDDGLSRIIYLDLINQTGTRITGSALEITNKQASGFLHLPDSLSSGTYLLRAYQKHSAKQTKVIREIWIANRFDGLDKINAVNRIVSSNKIQEKQTDKIKLTGLAPTYQTNQPINATIEIEEPFLKEIEGDLLVSISQTDSSFVSQSFLTETGTGNIGIIEKKGVILSGTIIDKKDGKPAPDITVYFTIPDSIPGFQYYITRQDGRYYFMPDQNYGQVQAIIQCFGKTQGQRLKIKPDDFFAEPGDLPHFEQFPLTEAFRGSNRRNTDVATFQKIFDQKLLGTPPLPNPTKRETYPYYGKATHTVDPQLFIDLPNFTEISRELLPGVKFRNYNNSPTLQVLNSPMRNYFDEPPLLLIDGIPVSDLNVIKELGTTDIDRVDICQNERFYGNLRFPGVVAIFTTKSDYSMIPETDQLIRLNPKIIQEKVKLVEPAPEEATIPDLRQLLYWEPNVLPGAKVRVDCKASSITGPFKVIIRGKLKDGALFFAEQLVEIK